MSPLAVSNESSESVCSMLRAMRSEVSRPSSDGTIQCEAVCQVHGPIFPFSRYGLCAKLTCSNFLVALFLGRFNLHAVFDHLQYAKYGGEGLGDLIMCGDVR